MVRAGPDTLSFCKELKPCKTNKRGKLFENFRDSVEGLYIP